MKKTVPTIGMIACFIVAIFFGYKAWNLHVEYQKADHEYQKIKKMKKKKEVLILKDCIRSIQISLHGLKFLERISIIQLYKEKIMKNICIIPFGKIIISLDASS